MLFNSITFLVFAFIFYALYYLVFTKQKVVVRNLFLLCASYIFYGFWDYRFLILIAISTVIDFYVAKWLYQAKTRRKEILLISLIANLGMLAFFKYCNFGIESFVQLSNAIGIKAHVSTLNIILPVGISFYTFQTLSYTIDVYRNKLKPTNNFISFATFVAFFPQLVAGPIEKASDLIPQIENKASKINFEKGLFLILIGFFKKIALADTLAPLVNYTFENVDHISGLDSLMGLAGFSIQIYGDFAGYTFIAIGLAELMGIQLTKNFDTPYLALSPREFWRRWHISLSNWLTTYLYFSLGGNKFGQFKKYRNIMLTMILGGLWHGASYNFVIWGVYHGFLLTVNHVLIDLGLMTKKIYAKITPKLIPRILLMYMLTLFGWLLFRVTDLTQLSAIIKNIFFNFSFSEQSKYFIIPVVFTHLVLWSYHIWQYNKGDNLILLQSNKFVKFGAVVFCLGSILYFSTYASNSFIYFQF